jgi:hypothetical protein
MRRNPGGHGGQAQATKALLRPWMKSPYLHDDAAFVPLDTCSLPVGRLRLNKRLDALVPHKSERWVSSSRTESSTLGRTPRRTPEPSVWPTPDACATETRDSSVSDEDLLMLNPGLRRLARDDVVLEPRAFLGHRSWRPRQVVSLSTARDIPRS